MLEKIEESDQYLTSDERRKKHGERKRLGELKREQRNESKRRKVLKLEDEVSRIFDRVLNSFILPEKHNPTIRKMYG